MERSDASSSVVTGKASSPSQRVTCGGDGEEVAPGAPSQLTRQQGPIRCCSDTQGAGLSLSDDVTQTDGKTQESASSDGVVSCSQGSEVSLGGGGATGLHLPPPDAAQVDITPPPDSDSDTQVSSDDDAFTAEPPAPGGPRLLAARNTFACGRRQSAPGTLQDDGSELQSRRPDIAEYFNSRKQRSISQSVPGWKLFGKVPPKQSPSKQARTIQQEFEARQVASRSSPTHPAAGQQSRRRAELEPLSTTALILEDRPPNLPAKSDEEAERHRQQYEQMVAATKRRELKEAQRRRQQREERRRQEEVICSSAHVWSRDILPQWDAMRSSRRAQDLWWAGLPPSVRGRVWSLAIGNELNITAELYRIFLCRAEEKRSLTPADGGDTAAGLDLITRDVSRTLPALAVFQKGGPYHNQLQSILGAYTCYRPDVGYMQGMSSMAAMLILNMEEVEVFISFSNLINRPCQLAFCRVQHQQMLRYFGAFQVFFQESLPRLFSHFQSSGVTPDLYLMDWILSLYVKPLPLDVASRVWDVFLRDGEEFLFRTALGILRLFQDVLLQMDLISIAQFLSRLPDEELLSDRLFSCISATPLLSRNRKWTQVLASCKNTNS